MPGAAPAPGAGPGPGAAADADPVTATYRVMLNPALPPGRRLLVLQHPNRVDDAAGGGRAAAAAATELRLKPDAGMVEADVALDTGVAYDREKGLRWGRALQASMAAKNGGSHGLAGGFGLGAVQQRAGGRRRGGAGADADDPDAVLDWNEAVLQDKVLRTQTLGGQCPDADEVQYMVGVFRGEDLHLTPVSSLVLLRPQPHHIDAVAQQDRSASSAAAKDAAPGAATAARAIHMTIKTASDGDAVTTETMADRLRSVQAEPWRKLRYTDENDEAAWDVYNESLFFAPRPAAAAADDGRPDEPPTRFAARWDDRQMLEAVSGIAKPEPEPRDKRPEQAAGHGDDARPAKSRPKGGRAKSRSAASTASAS